MFPNYLENIRSGESQKEPLTHNNLHNYLKENLEDIHDIFNELLERSHYHPEISAQLLLAIERQNLLNALEENLFIFCTTVDKLREQTKSNVELSNKFPKGFLTPFGRFYSLSMNSCTDSAIVGARLSLLVFHCTLDDVSFTCLHIQYPALAGIRCLKHRLTLTPDSSKRWSSLRYVPLFSRKLNCFSVHRLVKCTQTISSPSSKWRTSKQEVVLSGILLRLKL